MAAAVFYMGSKGGGWSRIVCACCSIGALALGAALLWAADSAGLPERLAQHRNLGKAFFENPTTHNEAVVEFKKALDLAPNSTREKLNYGLALLSAGRVAEGVAQLEDVQRHDPKLPHTWFNLGMRYRSAGRKREAIVQFERLIQLVPDEPIAHYQLGAAYLGQQRADAARRQFEIAVRLNPRLVAGWFQLFNLYRRAGQTEETARMFAQFQRVKQEADAAGIEEDADWCIYAEIYDP